MPPRSPKMKRFIFGFQRRVWWPKWTPASSSSRMVTTDMVRFLSVGFRYFAGGIRVEPAFDYAGTATRTRPPGRLQSRKSLAELRFGPDCADSWEMLEELAAAIHADAWQLALATVDEGLQDDQLPALQRLGRLGQLGDMPTFIGEL